MPRQQLLIKSGQLSIGLRREGLDLADVCGFLLPPFLPSSRAPAAPAPAAGLGPGWQRGQDGQEFWGCPSPAPRDRGKEGSQGLIPAEGDTGPATCAVPWLIRPG